MGEPDTVASVRAHGFAPQTRDSIRSPSYDERVAATKKEADSVPRATPEASRSAVAERRAAPRVLLDLEVDYAREENFLFAYITDISTTGIFIRTTQPEPPGTPLNLRFTPPDDDDPDATPMAVEGEVIWINPYLPSDVNHVDPGMGVRFIGLTDQDRDRLLRLVRRFAFL